MEEYPIDEIIIKASDLSKDPSGSRLIQKNQNNIKVIWEV